ncbi:MAG TPA: hypothetical protein ENI64_13640 [Gammaproteobacteria bacterium]|nr:hypothetical protein [Gammaproteobacteria bacterium]
MIKLHKIGVLVLVNFFISILLISCESSASGKAVSKYDQLCQIYKEVVSMPVELRVKEGTLVQRVQNELPDFFNKNYTYIARADADQRYPFIKKLAEEELKSKWSCEVMQSYYDNEFSRPAKN